MTFFVILMINGAAFGFGFALRAWAYPVRTKAFEKAYDFGHANGKAEGFDEGYAEGYANGEADHGPPITLKSAQKGLFQL